MVNQTAAPLQKIVKAPGMIAHAPRTDDNGLGFTQGSTAGVMNTYAHRGFQRPQLPEIDTATRRKFNFRGYRGAMNNWSSGWPYACNYDPKPFYEESTINARNVIKKVKKMRNYNMIIGIIIITMILLFYF